MEKTVNKGSHPQEMSLWEPPGPRDAGNQGCGEWTSCFLPSVPAKRRIKGKEKQSTGKAEERRSREPAPTNVAFRAARKIFMHNLSPAGPRLRCSPSLWRRQRGESVQGGGCFPVPKEKGDDARLSRYPWQSAWLRVGFREMTLSPSGKDPKLGDPTLS